MVADFQVGGSTGRNILQLPTGQKAFGQLDPMRGDELREVQGNLSRRALIIGNERGVIGRSILGRNEYNTSLAPTSREALLSRPWAVGRS